jgi:hypothetical protein
MAALSCGVTNLLGRGSLQGCAMSSNSRVDRIGKRDQPFELSDRRTVLVFARALMRATAVSPQKRVSPSTAFCGLCAQFQLT